MLLYHYCSREAFLAIISGKSFRLTSMSQANDTQEGQLLVTAVREALTRIQPKPHIALEIEDICERFQKYTKGIAFCMSKNDDDLSQWRGYAKNGEGFCIGLDRAALRENRKVNPDSTRYLLADVVYGSAKHARLVEEAVAKTVTAAETAIPNPRPLTGGLLALIGNSAESRAEVEAYEKAKEALFDPLWPVLFSAWRLKSDAFKAEAEVRALEVQVGSNIPDLSFCDSSQGLTYFKDVSFAGRERALIKEIWIGPRNPTPNYIVESFAKKFGCADVQVNRSTASYR